MHRHELKSKGRDTKDWATKSHGMALIKYWIKTGGKSYAEKRAKEILRNGYKPKDFGYSHRKAIQHVETGIVFESVRKAANYFGIAPCTISNAMRSGRKTGKGKFVWAES